MRTYERMVAMTNVRATETIIFYQDVHKYVRVTAIMIFDQVYVTDQNFITTEIIGVGYLHSYHSGQFQYVYHT